MRDQQLHNQLKLISAATGAPIAAVLAHYRICPRTYRGYQVERNKTEPSLRTCARILALQERCGVEAEPITFEIDGLPIAVIRLTKPTQNPA